MSNIDGNNLTGRHYIQQRCSDMKQGQKDLLSWASWFKPRVVSILLGMCQLCNSIDGDIDRRSSLPVAIEQLGWKGTSFEILLAMLLTFTFSLFDLLYLGCLRGCRYLPLRGGNQRFDPRRDQRSVRATEPQEIQRAPSEGDTSRALR